MLRIGLSASIMHQDKTRIICNGRPLYFIEHSLSDYVMKKDVVAFMLPPPKNFDCSIKKLVSSVDGVILHGGVDMSPNSYGETAIKPEWQGDLIRDNYELALLESCLQQNKPVLGICRGAQLINVFFKGTIHQDIQYCVKNSLVHRDATLFEKNHHEVKLVKGSRLQKIYNTEKGKINSVHHQAIKTLGNNLIIEAYSLKDNIIEAIRLKQTHDLDPYCFGIQWHPEFQTKMDQELLNPNYILNDFINAIKVRQS